MERQIGASAVVDFDLLGALVADVNWPYDPLRGFGFH